MNDQPDPTNDPTTGQPIRATVRETAARLGVSQNAVRQRLKRGTLQADTIGGVVYVLVGDQPSADPSATQHSDPRPTQPNPTDQRDHLVAALMADVAFLRAELETRRDAERELRVLLAQMTERVQALPATVAGADNDALQGRQGRQDTQQAAPATTSASESQPAVRRAWWRFWE